MTVSNKIEARDLESGNQFKMGGSTYTVAEHMPNDFGGEIIHFYATGNPDDLFTMIISPDTLFKITANI